MTTDVFRHAMYESLRPLLTRLRDGGALALEVSGTALRQEFGYERVEEIAFPFLDLMNPSHAWLRAGRYDLVFADQVLEHVIDPFRAADSLGILVKPGGYVVVTTVCLFPPHDRPADFWRFTPEGLRALFGGWEGVEVGSWGNWSAALAALDWQALNRDPVVLKMLLADGSDPDYPVVVWAAAQKPTEGSERRRPPRSDA